MVDNKWSEITNKINALGEGAQRLTCEKVKKKWFDLKSISKKAVAIYLTESGKSGAPGVNPAKKTWYGVAGTES